MIVSCVKNNKISQNSVMGLDVNTKGTIKIIDNKNNKYLGYINLIKKGEDPPNNKWIAGIYVYEKYIISQLCYAYDAVGITVYKNVKNINYNDLKDDNKLYNTYEHYLMGIYDDYLFLLEMGNSPTVRNYKIINLKTNKTVYEGEYIWEIGINFVEKYVIEIYENTNISKTEDEMDTYKYIFDKYLLNLKTEEKIDMNKKIEIIGD